jgi:hypothetical protein
MTLHKVVIEGYLLRRRDLQRTRFVLGIVNCESRIATLTISSVTILPESLAPNHSASNEFGMNCGL